MRMWQRVRVRQAPAKGARAGTAPDVVGASELLRALAHPHRVAIVLELAGGERCVHDLVDALGVAQPLVSQHLRVLRADHLVVGRRRGREVAYSLGDEHIAHIVGDAVVHASERSQP